MPTRALTSPVRRDLEQDRARPAHERLKQYGRENREHLSNKFFALIERRVEAGDIPHQYVQGYAVAFAILVDKRRLEDGQVTELTAVITPELVEMRSRAIAAAKQLGLDRKELRPLGLDPGPGRGQDRGQDGTGQADTVMDSEVSDA